MPLIFACSPPCRCLARALWCIGLPPGGSSPRWTAKRTRSTNANAAHCRRNQAAGPGGSDGGHNSEINPATVDVPIQAACFKPQNGGRVGGAPRAARHRRRRDAPSSRSTRSTAPPTSTRTSPSARSSPCSTRLRGRSKRRASCSAGPRSARRLVVYGPHVAFVAPAHLHRAPPAHRETSYCRTGSCAHYIGSCRNQFRGAHLAHAFTGFFTQKRQPAAGPTAETPLPRTRRFNHLTGQRCNLPRLIVHLAIAAQIARIVKHDLLAGLFVRKMCAYRARNSL